MSDYSYKIGKKCHPITSEVHKVCAKSNRKERYFTYDLKAERFDVCENRITFIPSREDSYDRLLDQGSEFADDHESVEDTVVKKLMLDKLRGCLSALNEKERWIIDELFFSNNGDGMTERKLAELSGIPQKTINDRKKRALKKLSEML